MSGKPAEVQKEAAKSFCEKLFAAAGNNYAALVRLDLEASVLCDFTNDLDTLNGYIDGLSASGGTNTNDALVAAGELLDAITVEGAIKNIVLCSDGLPENGRVSYTGQYTYSDHFYCYSYANVAYETAKKLKEESKYNIYALGFFHSLRDNNLTFGRRFMSDIASKGSYYEVTDVDKLVITFGDVVDDVVGENKNPIIVIPGIMGSRLFTDATVFDDSTKAWDPVYNPNDKPLKILREIRPLNERLNINNTLYVRPFENQNIDKTDSANSGNSVVEYDREYGAQDAYKILVDRLCDTYAVGTDNYRPVYFFSYDWRKSNADAAEKLDEYIREILSGDTEAKKVDLVCHSMGGLVASKYYAEYGSDQVNLIITCGTPYEGAPKVINSVMNWDVLGEGADLSDEDNRKDLGLGLDFFGLFGGGMQTQLKASFQGVTELLPTENYVTAIPMWKDSWKPFSWGDYEITFEQYQKICTKVFKGYDATTGYDAAYNFQKDLIEDGDGYNELLKYDKAYFVLGINQRTITAIKYQFTNNDVDQRLYEEDIAYNTKGDSTVPYFSSSISEQLEKLDSDRVFMSSTDHGGVVEKDECLEWVLSKLNNSTSTVSSDELNSRPFTVIRIACPVDVTINYGNEKLSSSPKNFSTNTSFGRLDILGASDDIKLLCLENASDMSVVMNGTDDGTMDYAIRFFGSDGEIYREDTFEDIEVTQATIIETETDSSKPIMLKIDYDGDGTVDEYRASDSSIGVFNITSQPTDLYVKAGDSATFEVKADTENLKYQWYVNKNDNNGWVAISSATSSKYTMSSAASDDGNQYSCIIANDEGHTLSSKAAILHVSETNSANSTNNSSSGCNSISFAGIGLALIVVLSWRRKI